MFKVARRSILKNSDVVAHLAKRNLGGSRRVLKKEVTRKHVEQKPNVVTKRVLVRFSTLCDT